MRLLWPHLFSSLVLTLSLVGCGSSSHSSDGLAENAQSISFSLDGEWVLENSTLSLRFDSNCGSNIHAKVVEGLVILNKRPPGCFVDSSVPFELSSYQLSQELRSGMAYERVTSHGVDQIRLHGFSGDYLFIRNP